MILTSVRILPNWDSSYSPAWQNVTQYFSLDNVPELNISVERQDKPYTLAYSDLTVTVNNADGNFSDVFSQTKITGTDTADLRAPLIHYGFVMICRKDSTASNWQVVFVGYVDPKSINFDPVGLTCTFTIYSVAKLLEYGNAERVHRFASICAPPPYVLFGYDLIHPATPPGGNAVDDGWWKLVGASSLKFFKGDRFKAVAKFPAANFTEGMTLAELSSDELIISSVAVSGSDLYIQAATAEGKTEPLQLIANQALMNILTPWYHGVRVNDLVSDLVDEVNSALTAAGYSDQLALSYDANDPVVLSASAVDLIDNTGFSGPVTGAAWTRAASPSTKRYLAESGGPNGIAKTDILQDATITDRSIPSWGNNVSVTANLGINSADYLQPLSYPNPSRIDFGATPPILERVPIVPQSRAVILPYRLSKVDWFVPANSMASAVGATKYAYRIENYEGVFQRFNTGTGLLTTTSVKKEVLSLYSTTTEGQSYTLSTSDTATPSQYIGSQAAWIDDDNGGTYYSLETLSQPSFSNFPITGGNYLYLIYYPKRRKGYYYVGANDHVAATSLNVGDAGVTAFGTQPGYRSGAVYDGTNIFFFDDSTCPLQRIGTGTIAITNGSAAIVGTGTSFTTEVAAGDTIWDPSGNFGKYTVLSVTDNTHLTLTTAIQESTLAVTGFAAEHIGTMAGYYWNGSAMTAMTLSGFPPLTGADFAGAIVDSGRGRMYISQNDTLYEMAYTFSGSTFTVTSYNTSKIDTPNYNPADDGAINNNPQTGPVVINQQGVPSNEASSIHPERLAWLCGPVDIIQGPTNAQVNYPLASDAILVATQLSTYIYSNQFGGVIQVADFSGMSVSTAISQLLTVPQALIYSSADQTEVTDPTAYIPIPTISIIPRRPTGAATVSLSNYAEGCAYRQWYLQYSVVKVTNDLTEQFQTNDKTFLYNGNQYTVAAIRYGNAKALELTNRFAYTLSLLKYVANVMAYEFLIPRPAATVTVRDPYLINGTLIQPLINVEYLQQAPTMWNTNAVTLTGRILSVSYTLSDNVLNLEIA